MHIGFVGLGDMGGALARRLSKSYPLTVFDLNPAARARLVAMGAREAPSLAALAAGCDVIFLCLPKSAHVRAAIFGPEGMLPSLRAGTILIDQTTGDPGETRAMASDLLAQGITLIDAPVSGGPAGADAGTIAIMVGATPEVLARVQPILTAISPNVFHAGDVGAGHTIKLANNLLSGAQRALTLECLALAQKNGIDPRTAVRILLAGGARNVFLENGVGPIVEHGDLGTGFTLELMHKDVDLACRVGDASGMTMLFGATTREIYRLAMTLEGAAVPVNTVARTIDRITGAKLSDPR